MGLLSVIGGSILNNQPITSSITNPVINYFTECKCGEQRAPQQVWPKEFSSLTTTSNYSAHIANISLSEATKLIARRNWKKPKRCWRFSPTRWLSPICDLANSHSADST